MVYGKEVIDYVHMANIFSLTSYWVYTTLLFDFFMNCLTKTRQTRLTLPIIVLYIIQCIVLFNTSSLYSNEYRSFPETQYVEDNCESAMNVTTMLFYIGESVTYLILSLHVQNVLYSHECDFKPIMYTIYRIFVVMLYLYIPLHFAVFLHPNNIKVVAIYFQRLYKICVFEEDLFVILMNQLFIASIVYLIGLFTIFQVRSKMKLMLNSSKTEASTQKSSENGMISELRRVIFSVIVKVASFNTLLSLYVLEVKIAPTLILLCQGFVSNTCIYYALSTKSKANAVWGCIHQFSYKRCRRRK